MLRGCDPRSRDGGGFTILHAAAEFGRVEVLNSLPELFERVQVPLDLEMRDTGGYTALMCAAAAGHAESCTALLEMGADPASRNDAGL